MNDDTKKTDPHRKADEPRQDNIKGTESATEKGAQQSGDSLKRQGDPMSDVIKK